ncbi:hypothetical protein D3C76_1707200 [compost metagenome]
MCQWIDDQVHPTVHDGLFIHVARHFESELVVTVHQRLTDLVDVAVVFGFGRVDGLARQFSLRAHQVKPAGVLRRSTACEDADDLDSFAKVLLEFGNTCGRSS